MKNPRSADFRSREQEVAAETRMPRTAQKESARKLREFTVLITSVYNGFIPLWYTERMSDRADIPAREPSPIDAIAVYFLVLAYIIYGGLLFEYIGDRYANLLFPLGIAAVPLAYARVGRVSFAKAFPRRRPVRRETCGALLLTFGILIVVISLSFLASSLFPGLSGADDYPITNDGFLYGVLFVAVLPAVTEEILCRGLILGGIRRSSGRRTSIVLCAAMFACLHLEPFRIPFTFLSGLVITWVAWETGSLVLPTLMHFVHNLSLFLLMWFAGTVSEGSPVDPSAGEEEVAVAVGALAESTLKDAVDWPTTAVILFLWAGIAAVSLIIGFQQFRPSDRPASGPLPAAPADPED